MSKSYKIKVNGQHTLAVDASAGTLLEVMEAADIETRYHCRNGFCGACRTQLIQGEVTYINEPLAFVRPGECLACCCIATSDLEINH